MVREPPLPNERPTELELIQAPESDWFPADEKPANPVESVGRLPVHPDTSKCVHARMLSVHAVVAVVPGSGEIRIPYLRRVEQGDFALFMDALVTELGDYPVRFTNVFMSDDAAAEAYDALDEYLERLSRYDPKTVINQDDKARLETVLDGFNHELEVWEGDVSVDADPVDTLVGTWDTSRERNSDHA